MERRWANKKNALPFEKKKSHSGSNEAFAPHFIPLRPAVLYNRSQNLSKSHSGSNITATPRQHTKLPWGHALTRDKKSENNLSYGHAVLFQNYVPLCNCNSGKIGKQLQLGSDMTVTLTFCHQQK
jgi:hypothetical protein